MAIQYNKLMNSTRKGQAAVEYLSTYGWAVLVLIIILGVILSSGILTPSYLTSEECAFGTNLKCNFVLVDEGGTTTMAVTFFNGFPYPINLNSFSLDLQDGSGTFQGFDKSVFIESGAKYTSKGKLSGTSLAVGATKHFNGTIIYSSCAPELGTNCTKNPVHIITGRIVGKVISS